MQKEKGESEGSDTHERLDGKIKSGKSSEAKGSGNRRGEDSLNMDDAMSSPVLLAVDQGVSEEIFEALAKKLIPGLVERIAGKLGLPLPELPVLRTSRPGNSFEVIINELPAFRGIVPSKPALINAFSDNSVLQGEDRGLLLNDNEPSSELKNSSIIEQGEILKDGALMNADISESALISPEEHVAGIVEKLIEERASELLSLETVSNLLDLLEKRSPSLVREAGKHISVTLLWEVLVRLLEERVSIRALDRILEALAKVAESGAVNDVTSLCEYARQSIGRHIVYSASRGEHLNAVLLDPLLESILRESSTRASGEQILAIMPEHRKNLYDAMQRELKGGAVLLAPVDLRRALWSLARGSVPDAAVISYQELPQDIRIQPVARLAIEMPDINNKAGAPLDC